MESFSGRLRDACLNVTQLLSNAPRTARRDLVACRWRSA